MKALGRFLASAVALILRVLATPPLFVGCVLDGLADWLNGKSARSHGFGGWAGVRCELVSRVESTTHEPGEGEQIDGNVSHPDGAVALAPNQPAVRYYCYCRLIATWQRSTRKWTHEDGTDAFKEGCLDKHGVFFEDRATTNRAVPMESDPDPKGRENLCFCGMHITWDDDKGWLHDMGGDLAYSDECVAVSAILRENRRVAHG